MPTTRNFNVTVNGQSYTVAVEELGNGVAPTTAPPLSTPTPTPTAAVATPAPATAPVTDGDGSPIHAPMPGTILKIVADAGSAVKQGDVVMILEAMKMENDIVAPCDGTIKTVFIQSGQSVETNQVLATIG